MDFWCGSLLWDVEFLVWKFAVGCGIFGVEVCCEMWKFWCGSLLWDVEFLVWRNFGMEVILRWIVWDGAWDDFCDGGLGWGLGW